jgi:hypothetical protein
MLFQKLALAALAAPTLASFIPTPQDVFSAVDQVLHPQTGVNLLEVQADYYDAAVSKKRKLCILHPLGDEQDDSYNLEKAVAECGNGGILRLPDAN